MSTELKKKKNEEPQGGGRRWIWIVGSVVLFFVCVVPICVIVILTLLGPVIEDTFEETFDDFVLTEQAPSSLLTPEASYDTETTILYEVTPAPGEVPLVIGE